jgi:hypothetical protein
LRIQPRYIAVGAGVVNTKTMKNIVFSVQKLLFRGG